MMLCFACGIDLSSSPRDRSLNSDSRGAPERRERGVLSTCKNSFNSLWIEDKLLHKQWMDKQVCTRYQTHEADSHSIISFRTLSA